MLNSKHANTKLHCKVAFIGFVELTSVNITVNGQSLTLQFKPALTYCIPFLRSAPCFIETRRSCLMWSVTGARNWQPNAGRWQLSKVEMKAQAAWKEMYIFSVERWTGAQHTGDGHRACPNQPHISSKSHLLDRGSLTQSLWVPEEPVDSYSTRPCCIEPQQQMLQAHFECGCYASP